MKSLKKKKRYRLLFWKVAVIFIILLVIGCGHQEKMDPLPNAIPKDLIKDIEVVQRDEGKRVIIKGNSPLVYTFFKLIPKPLELVVNIPQMDLAKDVLTPITVGDEVIKEIVATRQEGNTEIRICLNNPVGYQVQKDGNLLYIDVWKLSPPLAEEEKIKKEIEIAKEVPPPAKKEVVSKGLARAQSLVDVSVDKSQKDKVILKLKADGRLGLYYDTFYMKKPARLVVDLWGIKMKFPQEVVLVDSPYLEKVRLGEHPNKVRVVLDFPTDIFPPHRIDQVGDELRVVLGKEVKAGASGAAQPPPFAH
jgi:hypothetical protein